MKKYLLFAGALLVAALGCTKTVIQEVEVEKEVEKIVDLLTLNATQLQVANEGVVQPLSFTTEADWSIASDKDWITFDKASGSAGSSTVNMTVAANPDYDARTARVTLTASSKSTVFTVVQSAVTTFGASLSYKVDYTEQDITIAYNTNLTPTVKVEDGVSWLSVTKTKAAPTDGEIVVHVARNDELDSRSGSFTVTVGNTSQTYVVLQASQYAAATSASALYLGNSQDMYDDENNVFKAINQFAILFSTAEGDVILVLNGDPALENVTSVPAGEYTIDETGQHAAGTFSIQSGSEKYYTTVVSGDKEMTVIDGSVSVTENAGKYSVVATLMDIAGAQHMYSYQGELKVEDASFGAQITEASDYGDYNTYFTSKAKETHLNLRINKAPAGGEHWLSYMTFYIFTASSDGQIPVGKFTYSVPETDASQGYAKGVTQARYGSFYIYSTGKTVWESGVSYGVKEGSSPTLEITRQDDGRYTVKLEATIVRTEVTYDDNWNELSRTETEIPYNVTFADLYAEALADSGLHPCPDGNHDFTMVWNSNYYMPFWYGDAFGTGCHAYTFGWNYADFEYNIYLALNVKDDDWEFVQNFSRYCNTPFRRGTFTFSATPGENTLVPVVNYHRILNTYTGHTYQIVGGSITLTDTDVTYDLTATYNGQEYHFGGGHPATLYYIRDYHTRTLSLDTL